MKEQGPCENTIHYFDRKTGHWKRDRCEEVLFSNSQDFFEKPFLFTRLSLREMQIALRERAYLRFATFAIVSVVGLPTVTLLEGVIATTGALIKRISRENSCSQ